MHDLDSALDDIVRIRAQLAASTRFQGFAPPLVALTGGMAALMAAWQIKTGRYDLFVWVWLAAVAALMIGTEAVVRARRVHRGMADRLISTTLQRFLPTAMAGGIVGLVILMRLPDHAMLLPGLWQVLLGVGIFAVLGNLPRQMVIAAGFYFMTGTAALLLSGDVPAAWLMGLPFAAGQVLVAAILHHAAKEPAHG